MGGDTNHCFASEDESSSLENEYPELQSDPPSSYRDEDGTVSGSSGVLFDEMGHQNYANPVEFDGNLRRRKAAYKEIMKNYEELWVRRDTVCQAKCKILSYNPGSWISNAGDNKRSNYVTPNTTTLLLIGPKGSGKSSLINRISRVFEDDKFASERAQVTYNSSSGEGTYFLQEYMIPRSSSSFCLFDTRSLSENFADNDEMLQRWMVKGVRHGELVVRNSDSSSLKMTLKCKAQQSGSPSSEIRKVNFVLFVVNGFQVLRAMNSDKKEETKYMELVMKTFSYPYLSFKDDKPVIVVTHSDLLSLGDRARVRVYLGEKLGVPPAKQIFDIPDNADPSTELTIVDMLRYSLEHADKNLPCRASRASVHRSSFSENSLNNKIFKTSVLLVLLAILLGIFAFPLHHKLREYDEPVLESSVNWHSKSMFNQPYEPHEPLVTTPSNPDTTIVFNQPEEPHEPSVTTPSNLQSTSALNHSHQEQEHEHQELQATSSVTTQPYKPQEEPLVTPPSDSESESAVDDEQVDENEEPWASSAPYPTVSLKPSTASVSRPKSAEHHPCKKHESRSRTLKKRHPKSAVKWHKVRHLWLDSD